MNWDNVKLKDVSEYRIDKIESQFIDTENYISTDNMLPNRQGIELSVYPPTSKKVSHYKNNDVLVSNIRPYFKKIWYANKEGGCSNDVIIFKTTSQKIYSKFLYYQLSQNRFFDFMMAGANGTKMPRGNKKSIPNFEFLLPPLQTQKYISEILSAYDDLIENNLKRIKLLEQAAQNIYKEWFVNMRFPGHENKPIDQETGLPEGFSNKLLSDLTTKITDGTHDSPKPVDKGFYLITGKSIKNSIIDFSKAYQISEEDHEKIKKRSYLNIGDILYSNIGTIGNTTIIDQDFEFSCKNVIILRPKANHSTFLYCFLTNESTKGQFLQGLAGSSQKFISLTYARKYQGVFPNEELIQLFNVNVSNLFQQKKTLNKFNEKLKSGRDILLPRLMNQTIEV